MNHKVYVDVYTKHSKDGVILPLIISWDDGREFCVDKVTDIRPAASLKAGGAGIRYTCRIGNRQTFLFLEDKRWFVEAK